MQQQESNGHTATIICIRCIFSITIRPNTNTQFGLLFRPNRIQIEYSVQPYFSQTKQYQFPSQHRTRHVSSQGVTVCTLPEKHMRTLCVR